MCTCPGLQNDDADPVNEGGEQPSTSKPKAKAKPKAKPKAKAADSTTPDGPEDAGGIEAGSTDLAKMLEDARKAVNSQEGPGLLE